MSVGVGNFIFWQILPFISFYVSFLEGSLYIYIYIYIYIYTERERYKTFITSWKVCLMMFNERYSFEILLPSLGLIKHVHDVINLLYYEHWTDKWKYIPYISETRKVLKSCRSKMATWTHDVCDVHGASSLCMKTCWQSSFCTIHIYESSSPSKNLLISPRPGKIPLIKFLFPPYQKSISSTPT